MAPTIFIFFVSKVGVKAVNIKKLGLGNHSSNFKDPTQERVFFNCYDT